MLLLTMPAFTQQPESFFPSQVGNLWQYQGDISWMDWRITRDSIAPNGDRFLFPYGKPFLYRIDTLFNVYEHYSNDDEFWVYDLNADTGAVWLRSGRYSSWVSQVYQASVFGIVTTVKVIRTGDHPDSGTGLWYWEEHLASGFGLIYEWNEPFYISWLRGCVIAGDTFGTLVSLPIEEPMLPADFKLYQNYPNPFNPQTEIAFDLPEDCITKLTVFDILGKQVSNVLNEFLPAGVYSLTFDANNLSSGIYFYQIRAGKFFDMEKMLLIR